MFNLARNLFQKAQRRALRDGKCWYRGKYLTPVQLGCTLGPDESLPQSLPVRKRSSPKPGQKSRAKRLSYLSWNVGGLSTTMLDEVVQYMHARSYDLALLQETRWRVTREWLSHVQDETYAVVHSGDGTPYAGVMIIIKQSSVIAQGIKIQNALRWDEPVPGRLLHVQIALARNQYADILTCYQKRCADGSDTTSLRLREQIWQSLYEVMHRCSKRNILLAGMDVNTPITKLQPWIGPSCPSTRLRSSNDVASLHDFVRDHDLCAVNTWNAGRSNYSMHGPFDRCTLIDTVLVRRGHCDGLTRQACSLVCHPLGGERGDLTWHYPVIGTIKYLLATLGSDQAIQTATCMQSCTVSSRLSPAQQQVSCSPLRHEDRAHSTHGDI